jgi:hypothetical protein
VEARESHELAEQLHEHAEPHGHQGWFRRIAGIYIGVVAMLLAIAALGGSEESKEMLNSNIHASDTYAFYQAKNIRQLQLQTAAEQLDLIVAVSPNLSPEQRAKVEQLTKRYRDTVARYDSEPATGEGKKELMAKAKQWEKKRDHAAGAIPNFEYAEALYQIAIVLGSVAIVAVSPWLLGVSGVLALGGLLLTINGYLLIVPLSHGEAAHAAAPAQTGPAQTGPAQTGPAKPAAAH